MCWGFWLRGRRRVRLAPAEMRAGAAETGSSGTRQGGFGALVERRGIVHTFTRRCLHWTQPVRVFLCDRLVAGRFDGGSSDMVRANWGLQRDVHKVAQRSVESGLHCHVGRSRRAECRDFEAAKGAGTASLCLPPPPPERPLKPALTDQASPGPGETTCRVCC